MYPTVLVVDDSATDRRLVGGLLSRDPFLRVEYACHGAEALDRIADNPVRLILTDLIMPHMDGLALVEEVIRRRVPVPVILMTAHGNGAVAMEAMKRGASAYIPKAELNERLMSMVSLILGTMSQGHNPQRLAPYHLHSSYTFRLPNKPSLVYSAVGLLNEMAVFAQFGDDRARLQIAVALEQATLNAMYHGNLELGPNVVRQTPREQLPGLVKERRQLPPYRDRYVTVQFRVHRDEVYLKVCDEGSGFDTSMVRIVEDPTVLEKGGAHGLILMHACMDSVTFNDAGNEVTMIKQCQPDAMNRAG